MINVFLRQDNMISRQPFDENLLKEAQYTVLWIDVLRPSAEEITRLEECFSGLDIPNDEEREEIEESSRYWEDRERITINTYFLTSQTRVGWEMYHSINNETVSFLLYKKLLFTVRYREFRTFDEIQRRVLRSPKTFLDGFDVLGKIFEYRIEQDADMLEKAAKDTRDLRAVVFGSTYNNDEVLDQIAMLQDFHMRIRDSLFDKRRSLTALMKSNQGDDDLRRELGIALKDINSLLEFTNANMGSIENIQNLFSNQINLEQNKTIRFFTVITVAFMPPTLVGTIYGMNFSNMPELNWEYGYPLALGIMFLSVACPLLYFKFKKWL
ncbi:MAG: magnesium/cobalt transporter CorA [Helicobacter sp.]|nr:magnesium/cobalt transporter CorA [Helicobacter sp.]MDE7195435.1 magnesium/cobalt transporter CorA [Helicobacter sp.]